MKDALKYIGKSIPSYDVREKVTGKIKYVGDRKLDSMLYAKLLLSDVAHANIINIDISKAKALPGVVDIFTYEDTPKVLYNSHKWYKDLEVPKDEFLLSDKVRHFGDKIAVVVAKDMETAERAVDLISVEYEHLPVIIDAEDALKEDAIDIHPHGNKMFSKEIKCGDVKEAFKNADFICEDIIETQRQHHGAMETHVCLASIDSFENITIWSPCQVIFQVQLIASEALNIPMDKIRVIKTHTGGSFGAKGQPILEPICAFLAKKTGKPVKLIMDRTQSIIGTRVRNPVKATIKTAVDKDGIILGREINALVNAGAYYTNGSAIAMAMGKKAFRLYKMKNQTYKVNVVHTNTPIGGACRGYGSPQIHVVSEINMDNIARKLNMDPVEIRLKNLVHPFDKDPLNGPDLGNARILDCVKKGMQDFEWKKRWNKTKEKGRFVRGVGMACGTHGNGYHGSYPDFITMSIRMTDYNKIILNSAIHDMGCGTVTTMKQIVAQVLDIHPDNVMAFEGDTAISPYDSAGTQASRVTYVCGGAAKKTSEIIREKFILNAAKICNCSIEDIIMEDGLIWNKQNEKEKSTYGEMVAQIQKKLEEDISITYTYKSPANPGVYAANFVEVEVDTLTGFVKIIDFLAVHDIGKAINRGFVEGQIQGGAHLSIGFALSEEINIDKKGKVENMNFSKYHIINAPDMPNVRVILIEEEDEYGPFGAKSVGEICSVAPAPAIINAINNALDINITSLPATPEKILKAIVEKGGSNER